MFLFLLIAFLPTDFVDLEKKGPNSKRQHEYLAHHDKLVQSRVDESTFVDLENKSPNKQHQFLAQYKFEWKPVSKDVQKGDHLRWTGKGLSYYHHAVCTKVKGEYVTYAEYSGPSLDPFAVSQSTLSSDSGRLGVVRETTLTFSELTKKNVSMLTVNRCCTLKRSRFPGLL